MKPSVLWVLCAGLLLAVSGCAAIQLQQPIEIGGLIIRNATNTDTHDVYLAVEKTQTVVTCSYIPVGGQFSTEFPLRQYRDNYIIVTSGQNSYSYRTEPIYADIPEELDPENPVRAEVIIAQCAPVTLKLVQE